MNHTAAILYLNCLFLVVNEFKKESQIVTFFLSILVPSLSRKGAYGNI